MLESAVKYYKEFTLDKDLVDEYYKHEAYIRQKNDLIEESRIEGGQSKAIQIAKNMLEKNISIDLVIEIIGLPKEQIGKIKY